MKISLTDYARAKGVTYVTAHRWVKQGKIDVIREGKHVYVKSEDGKQAYNVVAYIPTSGSGINEDQIASVVGIHNVINKHRFKTSRFFYEPESGDLSNLRQLIDCLGFGTVLIMGVGSKQHIRKVLGDKGGEIVIQLLKSGARKYIDMEEQS